MGIKALALSVLAEKQSVPNAVPRRTLRGTLIEPESRKVAVAEPDETTWPPVSVEAERRFGQSHARLFPLIGKRVWTPSGPGRLLSVFADRCEILPDGATRTIHVRTEVVRPIQ